MAWVKEITAAKWETTAEVKARFATASFVGDKVVFNIGGHKYRLIVRFSYANSTANPPLNGIAWVLFLGTHADYDKLVVDTL